MGSVLRTLLCVESKIRAPFYAELFASGRAAVDYLLVHDVADFARHLREAAWDVSIFDAVEGTLASLDALPTLADRAALPLILVASSFEHVARASYRLQASVCCADNAEQLLAALDGARSASPARADDFERGQREIIQHIVRGAPLAVTLTRIVQLVERQGEGMLCTILLLDAQQRVVPVAAPSLPSEFSRAIAGLQIGPEEGSCGAAMSLREPVYVRDIQVHPNWVKYRDIAAVAGLRSSWSSPIQSGEGDVLGAFAMYYREPRLPSERERAWVERALHLAAIAVMHERSEQALRASEARYRQIVDTAYEGVWLLDAEARTSFVNARAAELLGYSVEEMLDKSLFDFMDAEARAGAEELLRRRQSVSEQHEFRFRRKNGEELCALVAASPLRDASGRVVGALGMLTDITRLKQAEATLSNSELEFRAIFENAAMGIALVDSEGRPRRSNLALQRMLGYSGEELRELPFAKFTHPDDVTKDLDSYLAMLAGKLSSYQLEKRFLHRDGSVVWGKLTASLVRMRVEGGESLLGIGVVEDISEKKYAEERIAAQAALLDQAKDAILVRSCDGIIEYWNKGAERLYGWSSEEAVGRNVLDLLYRQQVGFHLAAQALLRTGAWHGEVAHVTRKGDDVVVESSWTLIRDEAGRPQRVLAINTDVTEKKRLEAQVISAQRMESLGTLAGGIAHDFNNILAAILANLSLATEDLEPDHPVQASLTEINDASLRAAALVRQILTFSRRRAPERRVMHLETVVEEALKLLRATLPASLRIETHFSPDAPSVFADPTQVHQVVMNLGTNAAHAMSERGGVLRVSCERAVLNQELRANQGDLPAGVYARLSVEDAGSGMSQETLTRIFDPFFTTKDPGEGTGLGLAVVHGVMRAHEGGVTVHSVEGQGSRFDLYFPAEHVAVAEGTLRGAAPQRGHGEHVLYIDDEAAIARATTQLLERLGYVTEAHTQPSQALAALAADPSRYHAVVSDCSMPMIWGLDFVREILRLRPGMPIVVTSGHLEPLLEKSLRELGIREFVAKPGTIEELGAALRRLLGVH